MASGRTKLIFNAVINKALSVIDVLLVQINDCFEMCINHTLCSVYSFVVSDPRSAVSERLFAHQFRIRCCTARWAWGFPLCSSGLVLLSSPEVVGEDECYGFDGFGRRGRCRSVWAWTRKKEKNKKIRHRVWRRRSNSRGQASTENCPYSILIHLLLE